MVMARGRALQRVRPGLVISGVLQGQIPLASGDYVSEASVSDIYVVYAKAARLELLSRFVGRHIRRKVMNYTSFKTLFRFAYYLKFVEPAQGSTFRITRVGLNARQEWEDLRRAWQVLAKRTKDGEVVHPPPGRDITALTHEGIVWLCQEYALKHGLAPASHREVGLLPGSGYPDLLLEDELGTRLYAVEVKSKGSHRTGVLQGIGQCASYKCGIPDVSSCLVIPECFSEQVCFICDKLSFGWMSVVAFSDSGEFSLVYGEDSFINNLHSL